MKKIYQWKKEWQSHLHTKVSCVWALCQAIYSVLFDVFAYPCANSKIQTVPFAKIFFINQYIGKPFFFFFFAFYSLISEFYGYSCNVTFASEF